MSDSYNLIDCSPPGSSVHGISQDSSHFLLQGIFLTQGSNLSLLHCRQILYHLSHQGYTLNVHNGACQLYFNKTERTKKNRGRELNQAKAPVNQALWQSVSALPSWSCPASGPCVLPPELRDFPELRP